MCETVVCGVLPAPGPCGNSQAFTSADVVAARRDAAASNRKVDILNTATASLGAIYWGQCPCTF